MIQLIKILSKITFPKIINIIKYYISYCLSLIFRKSFIYSVPFNYSIEPINICNLKCPECPAGTATLNREKGVMNLEQYQIIIQKIKKYGVHLFLYFQGEPFLNRDLPEMIRIAEENGLYVATSTNANNITRELAEKIVKNKLHKIIISMDGLDQSTYEKYRIGGDLNKVHEAIDFILEAKKSFKSRYPFIEVQFLVTRQNEHQIHLAKEWAKKKSINSISFKSAQVYNLENAGDIIPTNDKYSRYLISESGEYSLKKKIRNRCHRIWDTMVICHDGKLVPCCFDKNGQFTYGNILDANLKDIWLSERIQKFRNDILRNRKKHEICCNCNE